MSLPATASRGFQVLTAQRAGHLVAFPAGQVGRTLALILSPAIPGSVPWLAGIGRLGEGLVWVFDPASRQDASAGLRTVVVAPGDTPVWGMVVDRVESLIEARRTGPREVSCDWPRTWSEGCLLADGRRALLIDPQRILSALDGSPEAA